MSKRALVDSFLDDLDECFPLYSLPPPIFSLVISFLPVKDLRALRASCSLFEKRITERHVFSVAVHGAPRGAEKFLTRLSNLRCFRVPERAHCCIRSSLLPRLTRFHLENETLEISERETDAWIRLMSQMTGLTDLSIHVRALGWRLPNTMLPKLGLISNLNLAASHWYPAADEAAYAVFLDTVSSQLPHLRRLRLCSKKIIQWSRAFDFYLPHVVELHVETFVDCTTALGPNFWSPGSHSDDVPPLLRSMAARIPNIQILSFAVDFHQVLIDAIPELGLVAEDFFPRMRPVHPLSWTHTQSSPYAREAHPPYLPKFVPFYMRPLE